MIRIGVLVSGRGSNLESILASIEAGAIKGAEVAVVISDRPGVKALGVARAHAVEALTLEARGLTREDYGLKLSRLLRRHGVAQGHGLVLLAGFMRVLSANFVKQYDGRIINIHPSLLPSFPGLEAQRQALGYGAKVSGCTVHFVVADLDAGPIIAQKAVPVLEEDDEESLSARILKQEHRLYPEAVKLFVQGRLRIEGRRVVVSK